MIAQITAHQTLDVSMVCIQAAVRRWTEVNG